MFSSLITFLTTLLLTTGTSFSSFPCYLQGQLLLFSKSEIKPKFQNNKNEHSRYDSDEWELWDTYNDQNCLRHQMSFVSDLIKKGSLFQSSLDFVIAEEGRWTCTCLLLKGHTFWNVLVLVWLSDKAEYSLERELSLPPHFVTYGTVLRWRWSHPPGLTSSAELPERWKSEPSDPSGRADWRPGLGSCSSLLAQHSKSWSSWHPKGIPFSASIKSYKSFPHSLRASTPQMLVPREYAFLAHQIYATCWEHGEMEELMAKEICIPEFCSRVKYTHRKWCWSMKPKPKCTALWPSIDHI